MHLLGPLRGPPISVAHLASRSLQSRGWPLGPERNGKLQGGGWGGGGEKEKDPTGRIGALPLVDLHYLLFDVSASNEKCWKRGKRTALS